MYLFVCIYMQPCNITSFSTFKTLSLGCDINQKCDTCLYWHSIPCCRLGDSSIMGERRHKDEIDSADDSDGKGDDEVSRKISRTTMKNIWNTEKYLTIPILLAAWDDEVQQLACPHSIFHLQSDASFLRPPARCTSGLYTQTYVAAEWFFSIFFENLCPSTDGKLNDSCVWQIPPRCGVVR